jgi:hypothetical protein
MVMMAMACRSVRQVLHVRKLAGAGGVRKVAGKLVELGRHRLFAIRLGILGGAFQTRGYLLGNLLILRWVGLLELLERAQYSSEGGKLGVVCQMSR